MEEAHTPAGYFIAIVAVLGGALLMPSFPVFIIVVGPLLLLGILAYALLRTQQSRTRKHAVSTGASAVPTCTQVSTARQIAAEEANGSKQLEREVVSV
ncbi:MAG TPA: hypothetical protein VGN15_05465 [Ktedonobacteraceae bacterium]|nr:hypothetical protein [Ktedonobacteraceae bacterium]